MARRKTVNFFISVCIIGKNEEKCIERCLKAVSKIGLPIVYTDTGSSDRTVDIASGYTDLLYHFKWCDDFSKARNFCAAQAPTDWIWVLDCDEYITDADLLQLRSFCCDENQKLIGTVNQKDLYSLAGEQTFTRTRLGRIYHRKYYEYTGNIHEQISPISEKKSVQSDKNFDGYNRQKSDIASALPLFDLNTSRAGGYLFSSE